MPGRSHVLSEVTWQHVQQNSYDVALLPWGATEAHNLHLPYGTDVFESQHVADESARIARERGADVISLPAIPFGVNTGQLDIPLTINMNPSTQFAILADVAEALEYQGVTKLVIINGHGGNDFKQMIRELQPACEVLIAQLNWWKVLDDRKYFAEPGDHAGELETSLMMHLRPDLVAALDQAGPGTARKMTVAAFREGWAWTPRSWLRATADTGVGNPAQATAEKGARFFKDLTEKIAEFLVELANTSPDKLYEGE